MLRGVRLFEQLTVENPIDSSSEEKERGRSSKLINYRNSCLVHRYYFYSKINRMRYNDVLDNLSKEFFISHIQIQKIIAAQQDTLGEIFKSKPELKELEKKYTFFNWKI